VVVYFFRSDILDDVPSFIPQDYEDEDSDSDPKSPLSEIFFE